MKKAMFTLSNKVTVYIPATVNINENIDNTKYVEKAATLLSNLFGGATATEAIGFWVSPTAGLVKEKTTMVFAYADQEALRAGIDQVINFALDLKKELSQDSVAVEINGEMNFF